MREALFFIGGLGMKIEEIVMFPTQLKHVETVSIKSKKLSNDIEREFNITANTKGEIVDKKTGKCTIQIHVGNNEYFIEEEKIGIFEFENEIDDEKKAIQFMEVQGIRILWSYVREDLYSISSKMLTRPLMIPTIDVMKTLEKAQ